MGFHGGYFIGIGGVVGERFRCRWSVQLVDGEWDHRVEVNGRGGVEWGRRGAYGCSGEWVGSVRGGFFVGGRIGFDWWLGFLCLNRVGCLGDRGVLFSWIEVRGALLSDGWWMCRVAAWPAALVG